jgi:hypothetical protein
VVQLKPKRRSRAAPSTFGKHADLHSERSFLFKQCEAAECVAEILGQQQPLALNDTDSAEPRSPRLILHYRAITSGGLLSTLFSGLDSLPPEWTTQILDGATVEVQLWATSPLTVGILAQISRCHPGDPTVLEVVPDFVDLREERVRRRNAIDEQASRYTPGFSAFRAIQDLNRELGKKTCNQLPAAVWIPPTRVGVDGPAEFGDRFDGPRELAEWIETQLVDLGKPLSADHCYEAWLAAEVGLIGGDLGLLIRYIAREELPLLEESLAIARQLLPRAFRRRLCVSTRPPGARKSVEVVQISGYDLFSAEAFANIADEGVTELAGREVRGHLRERGIEALGWYQGYHDWDNDHWGIFLHDEQVLALAQEMRERLEALGCQGTFRALDAIIELVRAHELFHAQVELLALRQELAGRKPLYRRYSRKVYQRSRNTTQALEEALANYAARQAVVERAGQWKASGAWDNATFRAAIEFIEEVLDTGPPGYRDWRMGADPLVSRQLLCQLLTGDVTVTEPLAPIDGMLAQTRQMLKPDEVPIWVTVTTAFADRLFGTPDRREVERFLRSRGYEEKSGGKHSQWHGPDGRKFPLPTAPQVSQTVFRSFLQHFGLTKQEYLSVRREL